MSFIDTLDGLVMLRVYSWGSVNPILRLKYNFTITAASVIAAFMIGLVEALGLIGDELGLHGGVWPLIGAINDHMGNVGLLVIAALLLVWAASTAIFRWKGSENALTTLALAEPSDRGS